MWEAENVNQRNNMKYSEEWGMLIWKYIFTLIRTNQMQIKALNKYK